MNLQIGDYSFHYIESGGAEAPLLLLLHGFTGDSQDWQPCMAALGKNFHCLAIDLPGHGKTAVHGSAANFAMPRCARAIYEFICARHLRPCALLGYSMGGRLALYLALQFPQYFTHLILESASPGLAQPAERAARRRADAQLADRLRTESLELFIKNWYTQALFGKLARHPHFPALRRRRLQNHAEGLALSLRHMGTGRQPSLWRRLSGLSLPTLLITGGDDHKFVEIARAMNRLIPGSRHVTLPGAGHMPHFEMAQEFVETVRDFLNREEMEEK